MIVPFIDRHGPYVAFEAAVAFFTIYNMQSTEGLPLLSPTACTAVWSIAHASNRSRREAATAR